MAPVDEANGDDETKLLLQNEDSPLGAARTADSGVLRGFPWVARGRPQNAAGGRAGPHVWQVGDMRDRGWGWLIPSNEYALQKPWYVLVPPRGSPMDHPNYLYRGLRASMALLAPPQNDFNIL